MLFRSPKRAGKVESIAGCQCRDSPKIPLDPDRGGQAPHHRDALDLGQTPPKDKTSAHCDGDPQAAKGDHGAAHPGRPGAPTPAWRTFRTIVLEETIGPHWQIQSGIHADSKPPKSDAPSAAGLPIHGSRSTFAPL